MPEREVGSTKPLTKQFNVYVPASLVKRVKLHAVEHERSLSSITEQALREYLDRADQEDTP